MDKLTQQNPEQALHTALEKLIEQYTALLFLIQGTPFYCYHTQKYTTYIEYAAVQNGDCHNAPPTHHQIPYMEQHDMEQHDMEQHDMEQHDSEYHNYYTQVKALLEWWEPQRASLTKQKTALQKQSDSIFEQQYDIEKILKCFKVVEYEWDVWAQIEQCLYPKPKDNNHTSKWDIFGRPNYYFLLAKLAYNHQSFNNLFGLEYNDFAQFLNQYINQQLTQIINDYVTYYHQLQPNTPPSIAEDNAGRTNLYNIAHIVYYWPFPSPIAQQLTEKHIEAKRTLLGIGQGIQQHFTKAMLLKDPASRVHPWLLSQLSDDLLIPYMIDYADSHTPLPTEEVMISIGFFNTSAPNSPTDYSKPTDSSPLPSLTSSVSTDIED